jgi:outer membrane protein, heavy metal efflux system
MGEENNMIEPLAFASRSGEKGSIEKGETGILRIACCLLSILFFFPHPAGSVFAESPDLKAIEERVAKEPRLSDLLDYAYQVSPMIRAGREGWAEALSLQRVKTAYPDPQVSFTYWPESVANDLNDKKVEAMISQTIPFPGKLSAVGKAALAEAHVRRIELDRSIRDTGTAIRESFYELCYIQKAGKIAAQTQALLAQMTTISETAAAQNRAALIDVMKAKSQAAQSAYDVLLLSELEKTEIARLNALLNRPPDAPVGAMAEEAVRRIVYGIDEISSFAQKNREEIRMAKAEIERSSAEVSVARYEMYPEFMLGVLFESTAPESPDKSRQNMTGVQFGMTLPLWWGKNTGRMDASRAALEKAKAITEVQTNETLATVRETWFRLQNAERLVVLYREQLVPQALKAMKTAETWFRQGEGSYSDAIETESVWYNFQLALARANADYGKYLARLEALAGKHLTEKDPAAPSGRKEAP